MCATQLKNQTKYCIETKKIHYLRISKDTISNCFEIRTMGNIPYIREKNHIEILNLILKFFFTSNLILPFCLFIWYISLKDAQMCKVLI